MTSSVSVIGIGCRFPGGICNSDELWRFLAEGRSAIGPSPARLRTEIPNARGGYIDDHLKGPSMTYDVSCSGSLAAVYYAVMSLQTGDCDLAIAGGVNVLLLERFATSMAAGGFLSKDFQCFTFDERANGYVQSEGCGVVILKRSADVASGERVYGEILGQSFNEDGRTGCISTPNGLSQSTNIRRAMARAGVNASELDFVQAHGTGTGVGDPIELRAILDALAHEDRPERPAILMLGDRRPTFDDLEHLRCTKRALQEAMRLYPPAWMIPHFVDKEAIVGGHRIPARSPILLSPFVSHRDPRFWPDPEVFDPERFSPERAAGRPRYAYYPFGGGGHQCIGNHLAMMETQLITAMMVQRLRLRLAPGHRVVPSSSMTLKPRYGMKMTLGAAVARSAQLRGPP